MSPTMNISPETIDAMCAELGKTKMFLAETTLQNGRLAARVAELEAKYEPKKPKTVIGQGGQESDDSPAGAPVPMPRKPPSGSGSAGTELRIDEELGPVAALARVGKKETSA